MVAVSVFEYAWGSVTASGFFAKNYGWSPAEQDWMFSLWSVFQAAVAFPVGRLREKNILSARFAMVIGAVFSGLGFFGIANSGSLAIGFLTYSVLGGIGSGMVYATCINMVGKWFPEKRGARTGFVNGGFAYGSVPLIYIFAFAFHPDNYSTVLNIVGAYMLVVVLCCGLLFVDPPKNWWPKNVDPIAWAGSRKRSGHRNPPAARQYTPMEAIRTGMLPLMWVSMVIIGGVSLFGIGNQSDFAKASGFGPFIAASSAGVLAIVNGVGRFFVGWVSDYLGRRRTLTMVLVITGIAQFGVLIAGSMHSLTLFMIAAFVSGFGSGAFYPLYAMLVPDYFGENYNATNYGLVYTAKLVGGVGAGGLAAGVISTWGFTGAYVLAGCIALLAAVITLFLRQPGTGSRRRSQRRDTELQHAGG
ncbi:OFA family MFS transporter [Sciscionella sediminilitoris]|uniref:OFA family MFS transporter n=1 Tax=Sciscionella sediminilitoris TaxID=1445613 RepID=UPI001E36BC0F|nr:OFA family MFS transporter [Sciscionella sp. SE31]